MESWDALNSDGEREMIPTKQLITQLQTRQEEAKDQRHAILIAPAVAAVLVAATVTLVLVKIRLATERPRLNGRSLVLCHGG